MAIVHEVPAIVIDFRFHDGSRPDNAHVPQQDVDELGKLVEAELAHEGADARHARIIPQLARPLPFAPGLRIGL